MIEMPAGQQREGGDLRPPAGCGKIERRGATAMPQRIGTLEEYAASREEEIAQIGLAPAKLDDVAPIFIYHGADLKYKKEAAAAFRRMKKEKHPLVAETNKLDDVDAGNAQILYNHAFVQTLIRELPDPSSWEVEIDQYGGYEIVRDGDGERIFGSDGIGCFAYYLDTVAIQERCRDLTGSPAMRR
jgi:hypothetical protein